MLKYRNFAVGTSFAKTEAFQTAFFGALGTVVVSLPNQQQRSEKAVVFNGILSGIGFAFRPLWLREASLSLGDNLSFNTAFTLVYMVSLQTLIFLSLSY